MVIPVLMPALSPTMTEGNLAKWLKKEGDKVAPGQVIAEIETDKAIMEVESVDSGVIGKIVVPEGTNGVKINTLIAAILEDGDNADSMGAVIEKYTSQGDTAHGPAAEAVAEQKESMLESCDKPAVDGKRLFISPLAQRIADTNKVDVTLISGSGPHGRIVKEDILQYLNQKNVTVGTQVSAFSISTRNAELFHRVPVSAVRKVIAKRLLESKQQIPHFYITISCILDELMALRKHVNDHAALQDGKPAYRISVNDFAIKAVAKSMELFPGVNSSWGGDHIIQYNNIDIAVAVATDDGLITPIVKDANHKGIVAISSEMKCLISRAKANQLRPEEFQGGGISISNLGMYGVNRFSAIVNPPQACILALGASVEQPVVRNGKIEIANVMEVTLSCDHRVIDGAVAAEFANAFKRFMENPVLMLVQSLSVLCCMEKFDLVVIGAGPGGYVAAIRAAQLGMKTAIVESEHLGGICLNWGCIPTKALLRSAEVYHIAKHASEFGIECGDIKVNFSKIIERSRQVSKKLADGIKHLIKKNDITVVNGWGKLLDRARVSVSVDGQGARVLEAKDIIIATGARAKILPGLDPDQKVVWTYKEAMVPEAMPSSVLVVGSGAIGIEFASFYNMLGSDVTVIEIADRILTAEDDEIASIAHKAFEKRGMQIYAAAQVQHIDKDDSGAEVTIATKSGEVKKARYEKIIVAAGVVANTENIGLENTKVQLKHGFINTNQYCQTDESGIWAIGDVTAPPWLAHKASHEAVLCVEKMMNQETHPIERRNIPGCTYCVPQIASVGYTEKQAIDAGFAIKVGRFPYVANGKAIAMGETDGLVKTIYEEKTGELLGAHMIGAEVTELIQGFTIAKALESTELEIMRTIFPHPTLSEMMHESTLDAYKKAIHI